MSHVSSPPRFGARFAMGAAWAWLAGTALQLQQEALWTTLAYSALGGTAITIGLLEAMRKKFQAPTWRWGFFVVEVVLVLLLLVIQTFIH